MKVTWAGLLFLSTLAWASGQSARLDAPHRHHKAILPAPTNVRVEPNSGLAGTKQPSGNGSVADQLKKQEHETGKIVAQSTKKAAEPATPGNPDRPLQKSHRLDFAYHHPKSGSTTARAGHISAAKRSSGLRTNSSAR